MKLPPTLLRFVRPILALIVVILSFGFLFYLCVYPVPEQNKDIIQIAAGIDLGVLASVVAYYFGSSKDKSDQDQATRQPDTTTITQTLTDGKETEKT